MNINELSEEYSFLENILPSNEYELLKIYSFYLIY